MIESGSRGNNQVPRMQVAGVVLPCSDDSFRDFIVGLLGKPQEIEGGQFGSFSVGMSEVEQTYHLIHQRVTQQQGVNPVGFTLRIVYNDGTSIQLNSFADFKNFNEPKPVVSTECHLTLSYLIQFPGAAAPEKQDISISFISTTQSKASRLPLATFATSVSELFARGYINYRIKYTARTWGADIEGLLKNHIEHLIEPEPKARAFMRRNSVAIGLLTGTATFAMIYYGQSVLGERAVLEQLRNLGSIFGKSVPIDAKLDAIVQMLVSGTATKISELSSRFLAIGAILSIILAFYTEDKADKRKPSFVVLTKRAEDDKIAVLKRYEKSWTRLWASIVTAIAIGVVSNFVYDHFAKKAIDEIMTPSIVTQRERDKM